MAISDFPNVARNFPWTFFPDPTPRACCFRFSGITPRICVRGDWDRCRRVGLGKCFLCYYKRFYEGSTPTELGGENRDSEQFSDDIL